MSATSFPNSSLGLIWYLLHDVMLCCPFGHVCYEIRHGFCIYEIFSIRNRKTHLVSMSSESNSVDNGHILITVKLMWRVLRRVQDLLRSANHQNHFNKEGDNFLTYRSSLIHLFQSTVCALVARVSVSLS